MEQQTPTTTTVTQTTEKDAAAKKKELQVAMAREALWRKGHLSWLLDSNQKELYHLFYNTNHKVQTWLLARRTGKSYALCVLAIEQCIRNKNSIVKFLAPTRMQVNLIIRPLMRKILDTCPHDLMPEYKSKDNIFYFPNGSELQLSGTDGGSAERLRGGDSVLNIVDEAGSCTDLSYCVKDILLPTTLMTKGKILLASTPPEDVDHDFIYFIEQAKARGSIVIKTIDDNPRIDQKEKDDLIKELGGLESDSCKRELYCKITKSTNKSVIPEFDEEKANDIVVKTWQQPPFFHPYVGMDIGYKDWTVVLFGYYDFKNDKIIIQDELVTHGKNMHLYKFGKQILQKEAELWTSPITNEIVKTKKRVSDHNLVAINELLKSTNYQLRFELAKKEQKHASINFLRNLIQENKIIILDKCTTLIKHLTNAKWATSTDKDTFAKCPEGSHYDAVDALAYLVKSIDFKSNPYPKGFGLTTRLEDMVSYDINGKVYSYKQTMPKIENENVYRKLMSLNKKR